MWSSVTCRNGGPLLLDVDLPAYELVPVNQIAASLTFQNGLDAVPLRTLGSAGAPTGQRGLVLVPRSGASRPSPLGR